MAKSGKIARFKIQRRLGTELPGLGKPGALDRRPYPPGENGNKRRKYSDYALRLEEKQKIRLNYELREKQLRRFIRDSKRGSGTNWVNKLVGRLELRLDNVVFRLGLAPSIRAARQLVVHGHVLVNDKIMDVPSSVLKPGQTITIREKSKGQERIKSSLALAEQYGAPEWIEIDANAMKGTFKRNPDRTELPAEINEQLIVELYSK